MNRQAMSSTLVTLPFGARFNKISKLIQVQTGLESNCEGVVVARAGVQPATFALGVRRSMQLSYRAL